MKRVFCLFAVIVMVASLYACSSESASQKKSIASGSKTVADVLNQADETQEETDSAAKKKMSNSVSSTDVDLDLTTLSSTMVYSEVLDMLQTPDDYMGMTIKMSGSFAVAQGEDRMYYACIIKDATACCSNGIEFIWDGDHSYPDDYPAAGDDITVVGEFDKYYEDGTLYIQLINAQVSF